MPKNRFTDSLGLCVDEHSIVAESAHGTITYKRTNSMTGADVIETEGLLSSAFSFPTYIASNSDVLTANLC